MLNSTRKYYEPEPVMEVVWHGAVVSEWGKGILLPPREQTEDERLASKPAGGLDSCGLTLDELREAVERLNQSLNRPIDWQAESPFRRPVRG